MPEITLPEVKLPGVKLPDGFREMSRDDIVRAARDVRLPKIDLPSKVEMPDIDLSKVKLPDPIADRLPGRRRQNRFVPLVGLVAIGAMIAAAWWLVTSPLTGQRVRTAAVGIKARLTGDRTDLVRYDDERDLGSLLSEPGADLGTSDPEPSPTTTF